MNRKHAETIERILLVDAHPMMRQGVGQFLEQEPDLKVCGEVGSVARALECVAAEPVDLVLADISLPDRNGLELIKDLRVYRPELPVLVFSVHDENVFAERVLRAGGRGYLMKREDGATLLRAVRHVLAGGIYVSEKVTARILEGFAGQRKQSSGSLEETLTDREFEIFLLIGQGKSSREIAERVRIGVKTVEVHRANIRRRLKVKTGAELVRYAVRWTESRQP